MHPLEHRIKSQFTEDNIFSDNNHTVIVGASGGPDSTALLHILASLQVVLKFSLVGVYVNHGLRISEVKAEEKYVQSLCNGLAIPFESREVDVRKIASQEKKSLEHAARDLRYQALHRVKEQYNADLIATGHTADDQTEEILIRLLRGSGRKGLGGMARCSGIIIRPLLQVRKIEILGYLEDKGIAYCNDSSNDDMRFLRNRVRHQLIPYLEKKFDSGVRNALCKTAESLAEDEVLLEELTEKAFADVVSDNKVDVKTGLAEIRLDRKKFIALPNALQRRVAEELLWQLQNKANYTHILKIISTAQSGETGKEIHLKMGLRIGVDRRYLTFVYPQGQKPWRGKLFSGE